MKLPHNTLTIGEKSPRYVNRLKKNNYIFLSLLSPLTPLNFLYNHNT